MPEDSAAQMSLEDAAATTGLEVSYLRWAIVAGLLQGAQGDDGKWYLSDARAAAVADHQDNSSVAAEGTMPVSELRPESAETLGSENSGRKASPQGAMSEIARLRSQLENREARLDEKDRIIASLGASLAKLGRAAAERFS